MMLRWLAALAALLALSAPVGARDRPPNFVIILADDLGYGDIGAYGQKTIRTPHIDRLARGGVLLTDYYAAANVCTPSRAGLLTGRYPIRMGLAFQVLRPGDTHGLPPSEVTIPEVLAPRGYTSAMFGKWHLGHVAPHWPPRVHGFDQYFGLPYSHDMKPLAMFDDRVPGVDYVKRETVDFAELTQEFTAGAVKFIDGVGTKPFFLMITHTAPHLPLVPHAGHKGHSKAHAYGDVVEEVDASVGTVMAALKRNGLDHNTLVIVTSDNGPWFEGDVGGLQGRKGAAGYDGGFRVPFIAHWPAQIRGGRTSNAIAMGIDLLPTLAALAGAKLPAGLEIDGRNIGPMLLRGAPTPHDHLVLFNNEDVSAIRTQQWKLVVRAHYRTLDIPLAEFRHAPLFDMARDPGENYAANQSAPDLVAALTKVAEAEKARFAPMRTRPEKPFAVPKE
jgi:arylsulfatase A